MPSRHSRPSRAASLRKFCRQYDLTRDQVARLAGISPGDLARYIKGGSLGRARFSRLQKVVHLINDMGKTIKNHMIGPWLFRPNPGFGGTTPAQIIERLQFGRIERLLYEIRSGQPD